MMGWLLLHASMHSLGRGVLANPINEEPNFGADTGQVLIATRGSPKAHDTLQVVNAVLHLIEAISAVATTRVWIARPSSAQLIGTKT